MQINGTPGDDNLIGTDGDDFIHPGPGNDTVAAGKGNDYIVAGGSGDGGSDTIDGGEGRDVVSYNFGGDGAGVTFTSSGSGPGTRMQADPLGGVDSLTNIEEVHIFGGSGNDVLTGDAGNNYIAGNDGNDTLVAGAGDDSLQGGSGNDILDGGANGQYVDNVDYSNSTAGVNVNLTTGIASDGLGGTDTLIGIEGMSGSAFGDTLVGDGNSNWFRPGAGNDSVDGGGGQDVVFYEDSTQGVVVNLQTGVATGAGIGTDSLVSIEAVHGSYHDDQLALADGGGYVFGRAGNDVLTGGSGNDNFIAGSGNDVIHGGAGQDNLSYTEDTFDNGSLPPTGTGVTVNLSTGMATDNWGTTDTFDGIEGVHGSGLNDTITGDASSNFLNGDRGDDNILGMGGSDFLQGGLGNDTLSGMGDNDNLNGGDGDDLLDGGAGDFDQADYFDAGGAVTVDLAAGTSSGAAGNDTLVSIENANGSQFADVLTGNAGRNNLQGSGGNDILSGGGGDDFLQGGDGSDQIDGGSGANDMAGYFDSSNGVGVNLTTNVNTGGAAGDTLVNIENLGGSAFNDTLTGNAQNNFLDGSGGNDSLAGLDGNDNLSGGLGDDALDGGNGIDNVGYFSASGSVNVNLATGLATGAAGNDTLTGIENIAGSAFDDTLTGSAASNFIDGGNGNDQIFGLDGNDNLSGGLGNDSLDGGNGTGDSASYFGATGAVVVNLATGTATGAAGNDTLTGIENIAGSAYDDTLTGSAANNFIDGGNGNDQIFGLDGNDNLSGGLGNDLLDGGNGTGDNASYFGATGAVVVNLATGTATGAAGNDTLMGIENVSGSEFDDSITGDGNVNFIDGRGGNDMLLGGAGRDNFVGGAGNDSIDGGAILDRVNYTDLNTISYGNATSAINLNLQTSVVQDGLGGTDTLANINFVTGSQFNDIIVGSNAANLFEQFDGAGGNDLIDGGAIDPVLQRNSNRVSYAGASGPVSVNLAAGTATGAAGTDTLLNINNATGSSSNDILVGSNSAITEQFEGRGGDDLINGAGGIDIARYDSGATGVNVNLATGVASDGLGGTDTLLNIEGIRGSSFDDVLTGGNALNTVIEIFTGNAGNDLIDGGAGYDRADYLTSTSGVLVTLGGSAAGSASDGLGGMDTLINIEAVRGSAFDDALTGSDSAAFESFEGRDGNDVIDGKGGIDRVDYQFAVGGVTVNLKAGTALDGNGGTDSMQNIENVRGSAFNDLLTGSKGSNTFEGGAGNDRISGGSGVDTAVFSGTQASYTIVKHGNKVTVTGADGIDVLKSIEVLQFSDGSLNLKGKGSNGQNSQGDGDDNDDGDWTDADGHDSWKAQDGGRHDGDRIWTGHEGSASHDSGSDASHGHGSDWTYGA